MKLQDLKQLDEGALKAKVSELKKEMMNLRFQRTAGQLEKTHQFKIVRRTVARAKTLLTQRTKAV